MAAGGKVTHEGTAVTVPAPAPEATLVLAPSSNFEGVRSAIEQLGLLKAEAGWTLDFDAGNDTLRFRGPRSGPAISYFMPGQPEIIFRLDAASGRLTGVDLEQFIAVLSKTDDRWGLLYRQYLLRRLLSRVRRLPFLLNLLATFDRGLQVIAGDTIESTASTRVGLQAS